jgi:AraC-like DNA-binding protein
LYTAQAAMMIYGTEPERALRMIDTALLVGNVNPFLADFLRAKVYANSEVASQLDKAIALGESLLQHDSTHVVNASTARNRRNVLDVLMDACRLKNDEEHWLQFAIERAELSRQDGMETEALRMEAEIGAALTRLGHREEGLDKLDRTIRALDGGAPSVDRLDAGIIARKRKIAALEDSERFPEIIPEANAILRKLEEYERNPSAYAEDSFRLPAHPEDRARYCRFYKAQAHAYLACAYTRTTPPDYPEVRKHARLVEASDYGRSISFRQMLSPAWKALGEWDKLLSVDEESVRLMGADTLNAQYGNILKDRVDAARARGQFHQAFSYMDRYVDLQNRLTQNRLETQAQEYAARYHAMEQDRKIQEAEARAARKDLYLAIIVAILLGITLFALFALRQRSAISEKNRALVRMINELTDVRESSRLSMPKPDQKLFEEIDATIRKEKLYANVFLQRQDIVERFDISRRSLNGLLSAYADGQSFTAYINGLRLEDALHQLQENPGLSLRDIAEAVGFTPANFREQFKRQYGVTPSEYRQNL